MSGTSVQRRITRAVVSAAGRPTALDTERLPKTLIDIEGETLLSHVLRQLYGGGILHVLVLVSHHSSLIVKELQEISESLPDICIQVADLGSDYQGFYARSFLAAGDHCLPREGEPGVLIATADHILDERIIEDMCKVPLQAQHTEACVLVDFSNKPFDGLPETAVAVRCADGMRATELSRNLARPIIRGAPCTSGIGIEAGLFACTRSIFDRLEMLGKAHEYFTLTEAIQQLADEGLVSCLATSGRRWVAVETTEELDRSRKARVPTTGSFMKRYTTGNTAASTPSASPGSGTPQFLLEPVPVFFVGGDAGCRITKSK